MGWSPWSDPPTDWDPFLNSKDTQSRQKVAGIPVGRPSPPERSWTIVGVGDIMMGTNYPKPILPPNDARDLLTDVIPILSAADLTFGNLEGTLLDKGGTPKRCNDPSACYAFRSPEIYGQRLEEAGFDMVSLANNHNGDFGPTGRRKTKEILDRHGIAYAGLEGTDEYAVIERNGLRVGMCAFAPNTGTVSIHDLGKARQLVKKLEADCDVVIVSFHGGAEGEKHQHVPRARETYYGENRGDVYRFAHAVVDAGADIVFGHGPHVTRAAEVYKDRFIIYSMGNFCTYGRFNLRGAAGIAPIVAVEIDQDGRFRGGTITPIYQKKYHGPKVDPERKAISKLQELSTADFPESPLRIADDGILSVE